ncbi:MAG: two-component regulator propeller domain-containing protein, partial [Bacteroidales bacterium]
MKNKILFFLLLSVKLCLPGYSVNVSERFLFSNISLDQGLSQSTVLDIVQDSLGYIWMATQNGLNRYDGYKFSVFKPDLSDEKSIFSSYHQNLCVDWKNRIWIGGENGASYYDYDLGGFKNYDLQEIGDRNFVSGIVVDKQKQIWISTKGGAVYLYDDDTDSFGKVSDRTFQNTVSFIEEIVDKGNQLLICSPKGLFSFNKKSRELVPILIDGKSRGVHDVKIGKDASLWVGTASDGLYLLDHEYQVSAHFKHRANSRESILGNKIRALAIDNTGLVWIGTFNGLSILNPFTRTIDNYINENDRESSLSHNSVRSIFCDNKNGMWVGTFYGGVNYFHKDNIKFNTINKYSQPMPLNDILEEQVPEALA